MNPGIKPIWIVYGVAAGLGVFLLNRALDGRLISGAVTSVAGAVAQVPVDVVFGVTDALIGLPDTRTAQTQTACEKAKAEGNDWEASFVCPASDWFGGLFDGK